MRSFVAIALLLTVTATATAQIGPAADTGAIRARIPTTLAFLAERIEEVTFEDAPLDQVMEWIAGLTPMNVVVRWQILEESGIERDKPISMNVRNLRLSQVLWMIMDEAGGTDIKLAYRASGELLIISTEDDLGQEMVVRVYDVSDLLVRAPYFTSAPHMDLAQDSGSGGSGSQNIFGGSSSGSSNDDDDDQSRNGEDNEDMDELIELIIQTVEPDSWVDNGGVGTISDFGNLLVVRNSILVHQALGGYVRESD